MLTPAEELGLSGLALASRVQRALHCLPEAALAGSSTGCRPPSSSTWSTCTTLTWLLTLPSAAVHEFFIPEGLA